MTYYHNKNRFLVHHAIKNKNINVIKLSENSMLVKLNERVSKNKQNKKKEKQTRKTLGKARVVVGKN
jgi:hypothetical protein